jgi:hypothetical protein
MLIADLGCELEIVRGPGCLVVRVKSLEPDELHPQPLAEDLWALLQQHFTNRLLLDLTAVKKMDAYLIEQLARLCRRIHEHDGTLHVCGLSKRDQQALRAGCPGESVPCFRSRAEATRDCRCVGRPK